MRRSGLVPVAGWGRPVLSLRVGSRPRSWPASLAITGHPDALAAAASAASPACYAASREAAVSATLSATVEAPDVAAWKMRAWAASKPSLLSSSRVAPGLGLPQPFPMSGAFGLLCCGSFSALDRALCLARELDRVRVMGHVCHGVVPVEVLGIRSSAPRYLRVCRVLAYSVWEPAGQFNRQSTCPECPAGAAGRSAIKRLHGYPRHRAKSSILELSGAG